MSDQADHPNDPAVAIGRAGRPNDPAVAAARAGRLIVERTAPPPSRKRRRRQLARGPPTDEDELDAFSIKEFCRRHGISLSFYFKLQAQGLGPVTMRVGTRVLITKDAARGWSKQLTRTSHS